MKKIILVTILSLLLSIPSFALGNDYEFTDLWWNSVLTNSRYQAIYNASSSSSIGSAAPSKYGQLRIDDVLYIDVNNDTTITYTYVTNTIDKKNRISFYLPVGLSIKPGESFTSTFAFIGVQPGSYYSDLSDLRCAASFRNVSLPLTVSSSYHSVFDIVSTSLNSSGGISSVDTLVYGKGYLINVSFVNTSDEIISADTLSFDFALSSGYFGTCYFGSLSNGMKVTVLPSYVESNLVSISNTLSEQLSKISEIYNLMTELNLQLDFVNFHLGQGNSISEESLAEVKSISEKIDALMHDLNFSGGVSQNIYNYITQATPESSESVDRLQEAVSEAQKELALMKETIETVVVPTLSDINETNQDINVSISENLSSKEASDILSSLFENAMLINMMLIVISFATVGYVLYGKR